LAVIIPQRRQVIIILTLGLIVGLGWNQFVHRVLTIPGGPVTEKLAIPLQQISTISEYESAQIDAEDRSYLELVAPWSVWSSHPSRESVDWLKFDPAFSPAPIASEPIRFSSVWFSLVTSHPWLAVKAWAYQTKVIWYPGAEARGTTTQGIWTNDRQIQPSPWSPHLATWGNFQRTLLRKIPVSWTVRPAVINAFILIAALISAKRFDRSKLLPFTPVAGLMLILLIAIPTPDFRYFYPAFLVAPILWAHAFTPIIPRHRSNSPIHSVS